MEPNWLTWARKLQAIGQNGLAYSKDPFDIERFEELRELALEILQNYTDSDLPRIRDLFAGEHGHATPKVDVRGVVFNEDAILLVRERADGKWTLPGGWVDVNESPSESVAREVFEESGYQTKALKLLACYDRNRHPHPPHPYHIYKLFFHCEILGGSPSTSYETDGVDFFKQDAIPELSTGRVTSAQIDRFFEFLRSPDLPTDFD
ncbi:MAG: NUDIX hydrolase [Gemmatimonadota bacterium]|nr:NUDIX hydrolase [Gemmatimonadota bacterium]